MPKRKQRLGRKLTSLRTKKGWTIFKACSQTHSVGRESLARIEDGTTRPERLRVETMLQIIDLYWPNILLEDFTSDSDLSQYKIERKTDG